MEDSVLLIIDMQNDFVLPTGSLSVKNAMDIVPKINKLRDSFQHVLWTHDWHPTGHVSFASSHPGHKIYDIIQTEKFEQCLFPDHCVQNSSGANIVSELIQKENDLHVFKGTNIDIDSYSCFFDVLKSNPTNAHELLQRINAKKLYVCGVATDFCVKFSVLDGLSLGYEVYVIEDMIEGCVPENTRQAIDKMKESGAKFVNSTSF